MARCAYCNDLILFGGTRDGDMHFCNEKCHQSGIALTVSRFIPDDIIQSHVDEVHQGSCPVCHGQGPVDVHTSYFVWSALVITQWSSKPQLCCRRCGIKSQLGSSLGSLAIGWWGIPWGLIFTPVQVLRNFIGMVSPPRPGTPSDSLRKLVCLNMAPYYLAEPNDPASRQDVIPPHHHDPS
jgi:hypothetical protein